MVPGREPILLGTETVREAALRKKNNMQITCLTPLLSAGDPGTTCPCRQGGNGDKCHPDDSHSVAFKGRGVGSTVYSVCFAGRAVSPEPPNAGDGRGLQMWTLTLVNVSGGVFALRPEPRSAIIGARSALDHCRGQEFRPAHPRPSSQAIAQCLAHSRCLGNSCRMNRR